MIFIYHIIILIVCLMRYCITFYTQTCPILKERHFVIKDSLQWSMKSSMSDSVNTACCFFGILTLDILNHHATGLTHIHYCPICEPTYVVMQQLILRIDSRVHRLMDVLLCKLSDELEMSMLIVAECCYSAMKALPISCSNGVLSTSLYG